MAKSVKQNSLLANLLPDQSEEPSLEGETVNPFGEPFPTLPLWRRVDRQFWWNEHLSKPFIDAGVSLSPQLCSHCLTDIAPPVRATHYAGLLPSLIVPSSCRS